ncbi:tektin-B1-like [Acanthaster planci]|uniref:Tektin n=1 Tax=Acanthaster planci TaxID=133434 RepID=A0A8B7YIJ2_ACAPL|nr:tektin-B1-like [Acanthaster planci]XP_022092225.1 tektin-B1-like [Acanthaster planci]
MSIRADIASKPVTHFAPSDWHTNNHLLATNAEKLRDGSHDTRQSSHQLRNETYNRTAWGIHDSTTRLSNRIDDIEKWRETLEKTLADTDEEIARLAQMKDEAERALEAKALPLDVATECVTLRDGRRKIDVVDDEASSQLNKEVEVIEGIKEALQAKVASAFEQLCLLQEARQQLAADLRDKTEAKQIDTYCKDLSIDSPDICLQPNSTRTPKGSVTPQTWQDFSQYNTDRANAEIRSSTHLREAINNTIKQTDNDLEAQRQASEFALRKRIHEMEQAKDEDEWQKKNTEEEIAKQEKNIRDLERAIEDKQKPLMLAMTRLENRTYRPNVELCRDNAQYGLVGEVHEIQDSIKALQNKLQDSHNIRDANEKQLDRIKQDLVLKNNSLDLDNKCMKVREQLTSGPVTQTQKNLGTFRTDRELYTAMNAIQY